MVERKEVEALVDFCETCHPAMVDAPITLTRREAAALCRAWLALDGAPVGHADTATDYGGLMWTEVRGLIDDDIHAIDGQRVRIVKEARET